MNFDALVAPLRADVVSGAAVVARAAAAAMRRGAAQIPAASTAELHQGLSELACRVMDAQPAMAPLVELLTAVLDAVGEDAPLEAARRSVAHATEQFREEMERRGEEVGQVLGREIPQNATILTLSSSSTVRSGLVEARQREISVVVLEGRPMNEGQGLARTLAHAGVDVTLAVDAAAESLVPSADLVLLGADSVGDAGVVNKIGSLAVARSAQAHSVPVWVAADRSKWLPTGFPQVLDDDRPPEEVWRGARGVRVWNRYFECLPHEMVSRIVTDSGILDPAELSARRRELRVAPVLRDWADAKN